MSGMSSCGNSPDSFVGIRATKSAFEMPTKQKQQAVRECAMSKSGLSLPRQNPCAQCGKPIAMPEWVESSEGRTCYLWHCWSCDYRFEAIAFESEAVREPMAA